MKNIASKFIFQTFLNEDNNAITFIDERLSYKEIYNYSFSVSLLLKERIEKISNETPIIVGVVMPYSWKLIGAMIGIMQIGAVYVPINNNDSMDRKLMLLNQAKADFVLTASDFSCYDNFKIIEINNIEIRDLLDNKPNSFLSLNLAKNLAYIIYTSGTTGLPKGVMISHQNALTTIDEINNKFGVTKKDKIISLSDFTFDLSIYDVFGLLSVGGEIILANDQLRKNVYCLSEIIQLHEVTIWNSVPSTMLLFINALNRQESSLRFESIRLIFLSGDWINISMIKDVRKYFPRSRVISLGGATEGSIWSIYYEIKDIQSCWKSIPYGKPLKNQLVKVVDEKLNEVPVGQIGELFIGGQGVAQGYWQDEIRTKEAFINHNKFGRIYLTGDLGRYMQDGNIEFIGRKEVVSKVNGFRICLSEVSAAIEALDYVDQACSIVTKSPLGFDRLEVFVVLNSFFPTRNEYNAFLEISRIKKWSEVYDNIYGKTSNSGSGFNISGWVNSFTGEDYNDDIMKDWLDNIILNIEKISSKNVLEIGCGTGILFNYLKENCETYMGTDISKLAIDHLMATCQEKDIGSKYLFKCQTADSQLPKNYFDCIILNSIVQYFPSIEYFEKVLLNLFDAVDINGNIFIGDIYNFDYLDDYLYVCNEKIIKGKSESLNKLFFEFKKNNEEHLWISPSYFLNLSKRFSKISRVKILLKSNYFDNEMSLFRYDVVISFEENLANEKKYLVKNSKELDFNNLKNVMIDNDVVIYKSILNKRFINFENGKLLSEVNDQYLDAYLTSAYHPSELIKMASLIGVSVEFRCSPINRYLYDAYFLTNNKFSIFEELHVKVKEGKATFNNPLIRQIFYKIREEIKLSLEKKLPTYMIPSHFHFNQAIPLTVNGKINFSLLRDFSELKHVLYPKIEAECDKASSKKVIYEIISDVLDIDIINPNAKLRDIGMTSLLAFDCLVKLEEKFKIKLSQDFILKDLPIKEISKSIINRLR